MRCSLAAALFILGSDPVFAGSTIIWPNAAIPVPDPVHAFILAECSDYAGLTDESFDACIEGERLGYRATVMMLSSPETGDRAAERYRACRAGLGMHGGRFHRRRADCVGGAFGYRWRFENTRRASVPEADHVFRTAAEDAQ